MSTARKHKAAADKAFAKDQIARGLATVSANESVNVAVAASLLGCDQSTVRVLLNAGQLMGHRVGKGLNPRGVRIHVLSIHDYISRNVVGQIADNDNFAPNRPTLRRSARRTAEHDDAIARLRAWGI
jgi:hypothetical protein